MGEPNRGSGGNVGALREIDDVASIGPRRAGSEAERRTARQIEKRVQDMGREVDLEPIRVRPNFALTHMLHAVAGVVASVLSVYVPIAGLLLAFLTTLSAFGDLTGSFHLIRSLTPQRASQNVISDEDNDKPGLIVLVAHYDAPLTGMLLGRRFTWWPRALFISLAVITLCTLGRLAGIEATGFTVIQFIPTVVLIALTPVFADTALSDTAKGSTDNAAGVAAVLQLAESHSARLNHFDLMLIFTGASAHFGLGMRNWLKAHRKELDPEATAVIALDDIGSGDVAYALKEGPVFAARMHPTLAEIAGEVGAESYESREISDAYLSRSAGMPTLRISTTAHDEVDRDTFKRVCEFTAKLLERIDGEIGPRLG
jgi:Peptidase family M28